MRAKRTEAASAESPGTSRKLVVGVMFPPMAAPFVWMLYELNTPWAALIGVALISQWCSAENFSRFVPARKLISCNPLRSDWPRYLADNVS